MSLDIEVDTRQITKALDELSPKATRDVLQRATKQAAQPLKKRMQGAAPVGKTRRLKRSISATKAKRDRPGMVVRPRPKIAPHRHLVLMGTSERFTSSGASRGAMPANPFVTRVAVEHGDEALAMAERLLVHELNLK